ncbi:MAG: MFS transporter [Clostridiales bacterium]
MKNYRKLMVALGITFFGSWFNLIAIVSAIYEATGSKWALGMAFVVKFLPKLIFSFLSAFILDQFNKKKIMATAEYISFFSVLGLAIVVNSNNTIMWMYIFYFIMNAAISIFDPARMSIIPTLFKEEKDYGKAVSELTIIRYSTMLVATGIGGMLLEIIGAQMLLVIDAITFFLSASIIMTMKLEYKPLQREKLKLTSSIYNIYEDLKIGLKEIKNAPRLKSAVIIFGSREFAYGIAQVTFSLLVLDKLGKSESWLGIAYTAGGIGCVLGGYIFKILQKKYNEKFFNLIIYPLNAVAMFLMFASENIVMFLVVVFFHDIFSVSSEIFLDTNIVTWASKETVGRISSLYMTVGRLFYFLAILAYTFLLNGIDYAELGTVVAAILLAGVAISFYITRSDSEVLAKKGFNAVKKKSNI